LVCEMSILLGKITIITMNEKEWNEMGNDIYTSCTQQLHSHKIHWGGA
jgi:hypothetical protein